MLEWWDRLQTSGAAEHHHPRDTGDQRRFTVATLLVARPEPIPARRSIGGCGLFRVRNEEGAFLGDRVHACAGGEDVSRLGATVQHDDQRERLPLIGVRHIQFVSTGFGVVAVGLGNELSACRDNETPFQDAHVG